MEAVSQGSYFWIMTMQVPSEKGAVLYNYQGTVTPAKHNTRLDLFNEIRKNLTGRFPHLGDAIVVTFDVQPNRLNPGNS
ncbi:hypothetical protein [Streptomyces sp. NPDC047028]|uniref:hypothetical protein n=1 Tax=Streptomyces sp. NPDC047028 TaxID=3155793 RepID=UPI0033D6D4A3